MNTPLIAPRPSSRGRWQVGVRTTILLVVLLALVLSIVADRRRIAFLKPKIAKLQPLDNDLVVSDPARIAIVETTRWSDQNRWELFVPEGARCRLCLATRGIENKDTVLARVQQALPIPPGRHRVRFDQRRDATGYELTARIGSASMAIQESRDWSKNGNFSGKPSIRTSTQFDVHGPVVLIRRLFMVPDPTGRAVEITPTEPSNGILLWIEPVDAADSAAPDQRQPR